MMSGPVAGLLTWGAPDVPDRRLIKMLDFLGVPYATRDLSADPPGAGDAHLGVERPIASASTIRQALSAGGAAEGMVRMLFGQAPAALVHGVTPDTFSAVEARALMDSAPVPAWVTPDVASTYRVSTGHQDVCGTFSGLAWRSVAWSERVPALQHEAESLETLIAVEGWPVFARRRRAGNEVFLLCSQDVADLDAPLRANFDVRSQFIELFPHLMFLRYALASVGWRPGRPYGALIIDDPPLRRRHGFLDFGNLARAMDDIGFSSDIALIPWNFRRTQPGVAQLVNERRGRLGVCLHGCDHTASEFGTDDRLHLATLTTIGIERMEAHRRDHGVDYDRIMVFPQGVFSESAMSVLQSFDFLAAVNTEVVPLHGESPAATVTLAEVLAPAITRYDGFPLFPRRTCRDRLVNFAADIFMGKPCLLVAHHNDFADGGRTLIELITAVRAVAPELSWSNLGTVLRRTHLSRHEPDGSRRIRMFSNEISLIGEGETDVAARVLKRESDRGRVEHVLLDGRPATFGWEGEFLAVPIRSRGGESTTIRVVHHNPFAGAGAHLGSRHRLGASVRRSLCDIRDNYVDVGRHALRRVWPQSRDTSAVVPSTPDTRD